MRLAGRVMLAREGLAVIAIIGLCVAILRQVRPGSEQLVASFRPAEAFNGRVGLWRKLADVHPVHGTPAPAIAVTAVLNILPFLLWARFVGAGNYYSYTSTIAVLALILNYIGVGGAEVIEARR